MKKIKLLKNKKADIAITLLVVATLALFGFVLLTFYLYNQAKINELSFAKDLQKVLAKEEQINFHLASGKTLEQSVELVEGASIEDGKTTIAEKITQQKRKYGIFIEDYEIGSITYTFVPEIESSEEEIE